MYESLNPQDIGRIRERLDDLERVIADLNGVANCEVSAIEDIQWDKAALSVTVVFTERLIEEESGGRAG
jgi:hypothetical protein